MGNLKSYGGHLTDAWHSGQVQLLKRQIARFNELGIRYVLPAFSGFVPDQIKRIYPNKNFTASADWIGFGCDSSCVLLVDPVDPLFKTIGQAYLVEVMKNFGSGHFYSADVFNEMDPASSDLTYLANINAAIYSTVSEVDKEATLVMQAWLFYSSQQFWIPQRVEAFLSKIPIGRLLLLDLYAESVPQYPRFKSFYGHYFIWNMLHNYGGANGMFGSLASSNDGPGQARTYEGSSIVGIGITPEGINQNEMIYEFLLEKAWRTSLNTHQLEKW